MGKIILLVILAVILALLIPIMVIWSLNTLFPVLNIAYNLYTWSAVALLGAYLNFSVSVRK